MKLVMLLGLAFLTLLLVEAFYKRMWYRRLHVQVKFQGKPAREGEEAFLTERIENRKWLFLPMLQVEFLVDRKLGLKAEENASVSDKQYKRDIFSVAHYQRIERKITFTCSGRGYYRIHQANLTARGLKGWDNYYRDVDQDTYLYVYPRYVDTARIELPMVRILGLVEKRRRLLEDPFTFSGIRGYDHSDPMNRINWKATARTGELMVNMQNSTFSAQVCLILDVEDATLWHHKEIHEEGIRLAASLGARLLEKGIPVSVISNGRPAKEEAGLELIFGSGRGQMEKILRALSRINLEVKPKAAEEILKEKQKELIVSGPICVLITESQSPSLLQTVEGMRKASVPFLWIRLVYRGSSCQGEEGGSFERILWEVEHER